MSTVNEYQVKESPDIDNQTSVVSLDQKQTRNTPAQMSDVLPEMFIINVWRFLHFLLKLVPPPNV